MSDGQERLRIGELATLAGVNPQTLRYYERRGVLGACERTPGGHRVYADDAVRALRIIKLAQRLGFSLEEITQLLEVSKGQDHVRRDGIVRARLTGKIAEIDSKIAELEGLRATLVAAASGDCDDLIECAVDMWTCSSRPPLALVETDDPEQRSPDRDHRR